MIHLSAERKRYIIRAVIIYGILIFAFSVLQSSFFSKLTFFGAIPNIMIIFVVGTALYEGERTGAVVGIAAGVFIEAMSGMGLPVMPLFLFLVGYFCGIIAKEFSNEGFVLYLIYMFVACLCGAGITLIQTAMFSDNFNLPQILGKIIVPEFAYTFILSLPCWFLFRLIKKFLHPKIKKI